MSCMCHKWVRSVGCVGYGSSVVRANVVFTYWEGVVLMFGNNGKDDWNRLVEIGDEIREKGE